MTNEKKISKLINELENFVDRTVEISIWFSKIESPFKAVFMYGCFKIDIEEEGITLLDENESDVGTYIPLNEIDICNYSIENTITILGENINMDICIL